MRIALLKGHDVSEEPRDGEGKWQKVVGDDAIAENKYESLRAYRDDARGFYKSLAPPERTILTLYKENFYLRINNYLRAAKPMHAQAGDTGAALKAAVPGWKPGNGKSIPDADEVVSDDNAAAIVDVIDKGIAKHSLTKAVTVFRGLTPTGSRAIKAALLKPGQEFRDPGYPSTTRLINKAAWYSNGTVVAINLPEGFQAAPLDDVTEMGEQEYLLPRNTTFRVERVYSTGGTTFIEASVADKPSEGGKSDALTKSVDPSAPDDRKQSSDRAGYFCWQPRDIAYQWTENKTTPMQGMRIAITGLRKAAHDVSGERRGADGKWVNGPAEAANFRSWFGDFENDPAAASKVVEPDGGGVRPAMMYHGTDKLFDAFSDKTLGNNTGHPVTELGHFFTTSRDEALQYGGRRFSFRNGHRAPIGSPTPKNGIALPVYLSIRNPYQVGYSEFVDKFFEPYSHLENVARYDDHVSEAQYHAQSRKVYEDVQNFKKSLLAKGYDGIHVTADPEAAAYNEGVSTGLLRETGADTWVAFRAEQVKSVTNTGVWGKDNPDIYKAVPPTPAVSPAVTKQAGFPDPHSLDLRLAQEQARAAKEYDAAQGDLTKQQASLEKKAEQIAGQVKLFAPQVKGLLDGSGPGLTKSVAQSALRYLELMAQLGQVKQALALIEQHLHGGDTGDGDKGTAPTGAAGEATSQKEAAPPAQVGTKPLSGKVIVKGFVKPYLRHAHGKTVQVGGYERKPGSKDAPGPGEPAPDIALPQEDYKLNGTKARSFKNWFGDWEDDAAESSKVVNPDGSPATNTPAHSVVEQDGKPVVVYHGTANGGFRAFDPAHNDPGSLYGSGFYFTQDKGVAESYEDKDEPAPRLLVGTAEAKQTLMERLDHSDVTSDTWKWANDAIASITEPNSRGYVVGAESIVRDLKDIISLDGVFEAPNTPELKQVYLNIRNPLDMDAPIGEAALAKLKQVVKDAYPGSPDLVATGYAPGKTVWQSIDRALQLPRVLAGNQSGQSYREDNRQMFAKLGYDGIKHIGGDLMGGGHHHQVWIAWGPTQIKAVANEGTFSSADPDMYKGLLGRRFAIRGLVKALDSRPGEYVLRVATTPGAGKDLPLSEKRQAHAHFLHQQGYTHKNKQLFALTAMGVKHTVTMAHGVSAGDWGEEPNMHVALHGVTRKQAEGVAGVFGRGLRQDGVGWTKDHIPNAEVARSNMGHSVFNVTPHQELTQERVVHAARIAHAHGIDMENEPGNRSVAYHDYSGKGEEFAGKAAAAAKEGGLITGASDKIERKNYVGGVAMARSGYGNSQFDTNTTGRTLLSRDRGHGQRYSAGAQGRAAQLLKRASQSSFGETLRKHGIARDYSAGERAAKPAVRGIPKI